MSKTNAEAREKALSSENELLKFMRYAEANPIRSVGSETSAL